MMRYFEQLRLAYLAKAGEARHRALNTTDPDARAAWAQMAKGYDDLAAECDFVLGGEFLRDSTDWLAHPLVTLYESPLAEPEQEPPANESSAPGAA
jgi:hypothetical protein